MDTYTAGAESATGVKGSGCRHIQLRYTSMILNILLDKFMVIKTTES